MTLTDNIIIILVRDPNKWAAVKGYCERNNTTEIEAMELASKDVNIEPYDDSLAINFADAIYNFCNAN